MEINPEHPVVRELHDNWYKICALLLFKLAGAREVRITAEDIRGMENRYRPGMPVVMVHAKKDELVVRLVTEEEGRRLAAQ
jgi:hypothetical protein